MVLIWDEAEQNGLITSPLSGETSQRFKRVIFEIRMYVCTRRGGSETMIEVTGNERLYPSEEVYPSDKTCDSSSCLSIQLHDFANKLFAYNARDISVVTDS